MVVCFFFQAEDGIRDLVRSRGLGDVYKRQGRQRQPGRAQPVVGQAFAQNHISGPARCCDGNEDQALSLIHI